MRTCPNCQRSYPDDTEFCPRDGTPLPPSIEATAAALEAGLSRRFRIVRRLGAGGMGSVFLAEQLGLGNRPVALKVLLRKLLDDPEFLLRFQNEAASTARIRHPNVVTIHESGQSDDGSPYIAMEYLEGETLRQILKRRGALPVAECAEILQQVARGLNSAHKLGILHRDLKPDNIFVTRAEEGEILVKIVDFGLAKMRESATHTLTGTMLGTPAYMSPEQCLGMKSEELDARSDLYALGIIVYEMLTGRVPFHSDTPIGYVHKHIMETPPPLRAVAPSLAAPPQLETVVMKALAKERDKRQASVQELSREFSAAAVPQSAGTATPSGATQVVERPTTHPERGSDVTTESPRPARPIPGSRGAPDTAVETPTTPMRISPVPVQPSPAPPRPTPPGAQSAGTGGATANPPNAEEVVRWAENEASKRGQQPTPWQRKTPSPLPAEIPIPGAPPAKPPVAAPPKAAPEVPRFRAEPPKPSRKKYYIVAAAGLLAVVVGGYFYFLPSSPRKQKEAGVLSPAGAPAAPTSAVPASMVSIPAGSFQMGRDNAPSPEETPAHSVSVAAFYIDKAPITESQYTTFAKRSIAAGTEQLPVTNVSWQEASDYCAGQGKRLPTEAEWEFAARGTDGRLYPWGNNFAAGLTNSLEGGVGRLQPADAHRDAASPFGVLGMSGNVWQWTADNYKPYPGREAAFQIPADAKVIRGGSYKADKLHVTTTTRNFELAPTRSPVIGFRCAKTP